MVIGAGEECKRRCVALYRGRGVASVVRLVLCQYHIPAPRCQLVRGSCALHHVEGVASTWEEWRGRALR